MMFLRMCEKTVEAKNSLEWNQSDEASLFIYCQSMIEQEISKRPTPELYWPLFEKPAPSYLESVLNYQNYVINKTERLLDKKQILFNEQYLIKYILFLESRALEPMINRRKPAEETTSFWSDLQKENELYFVSLEEKKKNWVFLNKKNSVFFDLARIVEARNMFPLLTNSRHMDFEG